MKNTHCCQCGKARGLRPVGKGFRLEDSQTIFHPFDSFKVNRNPADGVHIEESPSLILVASVFRNGGTDESVHICHDCTTITVRRIRDLLTAILDDGQQES